jgi:hypothetical protein
MKNILQGLGHVVDPDNGFTGIIAMPFRSEPQRQRITKLLSIAASSDWEPDSSSASELDSDPQSRSMQEDQSQFIFDDDLLHESSDWAARQKDEMDISETKTGMQTVVPNPSNPDENNEWIDGDVRLVYKYPYNAEYIFHVGWATYVQRGRPKQDGSRRIVKKCYGCFECPEPGCNYVIRPVQPSGKGSSKSEAKLPKKRTGLCLEHNVICPLRQCDCRIIYHEYRFQNPDLNKLIIEHVGYHQHKRPYPKKPNKKSEARFQESVKAAPGMKPKDILEGGPTRPPSAQIHEAYQHLGRVGYHKRKALKGTILSGDFGILANWNNSLPKPFIQEMINKDGVIMVILFPEFLREKLTEFKSCPFMTDTTFDVICNSELKTYLCSSTAYSVKLERHIPLLGAIMYGATEDYFKKYFGYFFSMFNFEKNEEGRPMFCGMTCDFSQAQKNGFRNAFVEHFPGQNPEDFYQGCRVHFLRSMQRVESSHTLVPLNQKEVFEQKTLRLLNLQEDIDEFNDLVSEWRNLFPNCINWLDWYLHTDRRSMLWPVFSKNKKPNIKEDTNAQESINWDLKRALKGTPEQLGAVIQKLHSYFENIKRDYESKEFGADIRYKQSKRQPKRKMEAMYVNDGRAPDTVETLLISPEVQKTPAKRPRGRPPKNAKTFIATPRPPPKKKLPDNFKISIPDTSPEQNESTKLSKNSKFQEDMTRRLAITAVHFPFAKWYKNSCWMDSLFFVLFAVFSFSAGESMRCKQHNEAQTILIYLWEQFRDSGGVPQQADQEYFWQEMQMQKNDFHSVWVFYHRLFPPINSVKDMTPESVSNLAVNFKLFGILFEKDTECKVCHAKVEGVKRLRDSLLVPMGQSPEQLVKEQYEQRVEGLTCTVCRYPGVCMQEHVLRIPPFLMFDLDIDSKNSTDLKHSYSDQCTFWGQPFELIATVIHVRGVHFVAQGKFAQLNNVVQEGIYYYDDMGSGHAIKQVEFARLQRPSMLIYRKLPLV